MTGYLLARIVALGVSAAALLFAVPPLLRQESWVALGILGLSTVGIGYLYLSRRHIAAKYLVPGTIFLLAFQVFPVLYTVSTAFTNFGDGHRGTKQEAIAAIERESLVEVEGGAEYRLKIATKGDELVFVLTDANGVTKLGTASGLTEMSDVEPLPAGARDKEVQDFSVPTQRGAIKASGLTRAIEFTATRKYDTACDCIVGEKRWTADNATGYFTAPDGSHLIQGWQVSVGFDNFTRVFTDDAVSGPFAGVFVWNLVFAVLSVLVTFALGTVTALILHTPKMRFYRVLIILPYAMPSFAMLLIWRDMFNKDFGLINNLFGSDVDWMGGDWTARFALILVNLWLGFPYMFLVATGALQAIPRELTEAAGIDGASRWQAFRKVTLPLLLVALTPLLISSFAFNFNNFNVIQLVTGGGPFPVDNAQVGATDLLITYTYRLAFGTSGAQFGFAAAISVFIFTLVAVMSAIAFRRSRAQEEVYS